LRDKLTNIARSLRNSPTDAEKLLWSHIRNRKINGLKFRRQHPINKCVVDFVCIERSLVIELDGGQHAESMDDKEGDAWLGREGYTVLRFWNNEVLTNIDGVLETIWKYCR